MEHSKRNSKQQAHELIERMAPNQVAAAVTLLKVVLDLGVMHDPFASALANAPYDDEPVGEDEASEIAAARILQSQEASSHQEVLADFGLSQEDFLRMGQTPLEPESGSQNR